MVMAQQSETPRKNLISEYPHGNIFSINAGNGVIGGGLIKVGNGGERVFSRDGDDQLNGTDRLVTGATLQRVKATEFEMCT